MLQKRSLKRELYFVSVSLVVWHVFEIEWLKSVAVPSLPPKKKIIVNYFNLYFQRGFNNFSLDFDFQKLMFSNDNYYKV